MAVTVTADEVAAWGDITDLSPSRRTLLDGVILAVTARIDEMSIPWGDEDDTTRREDAVRQGVLMAAFRVWTRRKSPEGVAGFGNDLGIIRIAVRDPDVQAFIGPWSTASNPEP